MTYCVSDIHAEYGLFLKLLEKIAFTDSDRLIVLGDIVDKGPDSVKLLKFISKMPNADVIVGNHEYTFLKFYSGLMRASYDNFDYVLKKLREYFPNDGHLLDWETVDWLETRPFYIEKEDYICVHAGVPLDDNGRVLPLKEATREQLVYDRNFKSPNLEIKDSKCVLFGHTPTSYFLNGESKIIAYRRSGERGGNSRKITDYYKIHLDTGTWISGVLGCFCIDTCGVFYVNKTQE